MIIEVTQEDINEGCLGHGDTCPVARAVKRARQDVNVHVTKRAVELWHASVFGNWATIALPLEATMFIKNFGTGKQVLPITFELPGLEGALR